MDEIVLKINKIIKEKGIKKNVLIEKSGLTKQAVYNILNGSTAISIENLRKFANILETPVSFFLNENNENANDSNLNYNVNKTDCKLCDEKTERIKELKDQIALLTNINEDIKQQLIMKKDILMECMERNRTLSKELEIMQKVVETKVLTDSGNTVKPEKKMP